MFDLAHSPGEEAAFVDDMDSAAAAIGELNLGAGDDQREIDATADDDGDNAEESEEQEGDLELDDEEGGQEGDEPETAIDAPASLTAEEKAKFAALPKEAQQYVAALEGRRAEQVQSATTKAAEAQRQHEVAAARADAQARAVYAQQLKALGTQIAPQAPDPQLAYTDPQTYVAQKAQYDALKAQHDDFMQQAEAIGTDAETALSDVEVQQRDRELMAVPEVANEATREQFFAKAFEAGKMLGLDLSQIGHASASELKALRTVADWREKATKYDEATARQMKRVREGKKATGNRPSAAQPRSGEKTGYREARQRLAQSGDVKDAAAALARLG